MMGLVCCLVEQVGHLDPLRAAQGDTRLDRRTNAFGVDVAVPDTFIAHDDDRVAERRPVGAEPVACRRLLRPEQEHHLVAETRNVASACGRDELLRRSPEDRFGQDDVLARHLFEKCHEQQQESRTPCVDHARFLEDRQEFGGVGEGLLGSAVHAKQEVGQVLAGAGLVVGSRLGRLAQHREDRPSTGRPTALYAAVDARSRASTICSAPNVVSSRKASARPRRIWDRMMPLLPWAPIREPWAMAVAT